ncbi:MAG: nucleotidyltransferase family protein [Candidatus Aenigmarchaeota archaeon]|nr:nucleotidyltransferase family protein [Candidatus Aenigmarchaeota archaeon]
MRKRTIKRNPEKGIAFLTQVIIPILKEYDVKKAGIFGSVARGEAKKNSDIDLLIEFSGRKSLLDLVGLKLDLEERLKKRVDIAEYGALHPLLKERILKEEVRIYEER